MENRKRGRETSDHHQATMDDDDDVEIRYKLEKTKNFTQTEKYHDDEAGAGAGVFDFPWLKGSEDVNFRAEIDECLDSTFAASTSSYDYDDREILSIVPTSSCCSDIATATTATFNSCDTALFDQKKRRLELDIDLDLNLDLDLIDQFFLDNLSNTSTAQSSHDDQLKMDNTEDEQLKIQVNDDQKFVEPKDGT